MQLGKILFEEMNLPAPVKYGKGKTISTAADVLEGLAEEHEIARKVLEYRQLAKLKGTYVDALPALLNPATQEPVGPLKGPPTFQTGRPAITVRLPIC